VHADDSSDTCKGTTVKYEKFFLGCV
jgi:hypothetical protein